MAKGGPRPGAGRKPGSATVRTREIANRAASDGAVPLQVMLDAMRAHYAAGRLDEAAAIAKNAAPYIHPRLSAIEHSGGLALSHEDAVSQLEADIAALDAGDVA